jgi:hypothetical protein
MGKEEGEIEKYLDQEVRKHGGFTRKYTSPGRRGVPDRIIFWEGVAFAEIKTAVGELSVFQKRELARMTDQGAIVEVMTSKEDVDRYVADRVYSMELWRAYER